MLALLASLFTLGCLIAAHEFGHLVAAWLCRVPVHEFSVGFGPALASRVVPPRWPLAGVRVTLRAFPLGGYLRFVPRPPAGGPRRGLADALGDIPPARRAAIALAGPAASVVTGGVLFAVVLLLWGQPPVPRSRAFDPVFIGQFEPVLSTAIQATADPAAIARALRGAPGGLTDPRAPWPRPGPRRATAAAARAAMEGTALFAEMTWWLVANPPVLVENVSGPVGMVAGGTRLARASQAVAPSTGAAADGRPATGGSSAPAASGPRPRLVPRLAETRGYALMVLYMALLSLCMALLNLLPLPPFDGFQFLVSVTEVLARRRLPTRARVALTAVGAALFLALLARGTWNDLRRPDPAEPGASVVGAENGPGGR